MVFRLSFACLSLLVVVPALHAQEAKTHKPAVIGIVNEDDVEQAHPLRKDRAAVEKKQTAEWKEGIKQRDDEIEELAKKWKALEPTSDEAKKLKLELSKLSSARNQFISKGQPRPPRYDSFSEIRQAVKAVCDREGIDLALPSQPRGGEGPLYFNQSIDITNLVIAEVEAAVAKAAKAEK
ncbi:OmpH family outer membrane protein [Anatilimnocola floriformis]|uniref:OmpH family outer membrane protein n=1 Tax=Anatilimnocola floriformis TaxID=2948575 RepID=UPI0020C57799|nr:OmpH family outer membrane protein [Anatilimnocola floriformis]